MALIIHKPGPEMMRFPTIYVSRIVRGLRKTHTTLLMATVIAYLFGLFSLQMFAPQQLVQIVRCTSDGAAGKFPLAEKEKKDGDVGETISNLLRLRSFQKDFLSILKLTDKYKEIEHTNRGNAIAMMLGKYNFFNETDTTKIHQFAAKNKKMYFELRTKLFTSIEFLTDQVYQSLERRNFRLEHSRCTCYNTNNAFTRKGWLCTKVVCLEPKKDHCKPNLIGRQTTDLATVSIGEVERQEASKTISKGGWWSPGVECGTRKRVAIIIPFRNREKHLPILLKHLIPLLQRRKYNFRIFVIEQGDRESFNKGKLINIGFREALKIWEYDCFVFHDVDLVPEDDRIFYGCEQSPMHLAVAVDKFRYRLPYKEIYGGVVMMTKTHFEQMNGFSNGFWLWGGEDDDSYNRLRLNGLLPRRQSVDIARYKMIRHKHESANTGGLTDQQRWGFVRWMKRHIRDDGLNRLLYTVNHTRECPLYTHIIVDLQRQTDPEYWKQYQDWIRAKHKAKQIYVKAERAISKNYQI